MDYKKRLKSLNQQQLEAVNSLDGPLVVRAGPGTGKTQILTMRIENILMSRDVLPENILCLTFTESAAENMRSRLFTMIGKPARSVNFYTFHGFGSHLISKLSDYSDQTNLYKSIEEIASFEIIEKLLDKLGHDNPLSRKNDDGFYYIKFINTLFSWLKQSGLESKTILDDLSATEQFFKLSVKDLNLALSDRIGKKRLENYYKLFESLKANHQQYPSKTGTQSITELSESIDNLEITDSTKPITTWKTKWTGKNYQNQIVYKDQRNLEKFKSAIKLLDKYHQVLESKGYYDFDDMILKACEALETNLEFKLNVQEQYQYILVDEYQDTNGAQNRLLSLLCDNPIYEGSPNLMVVGDPDQAIFSFQGADSSLLTNFANTWKTSKQVTLVNNYRSGQDLLNLSKSVLDLASDRTDIEYVTAQSPADSYLFVADQIKNLIKSGVEPSNISIISKEHAQLTRTLPFLTDLQIPVSYERDNNILDQERIVEIIDLLSLIQAIVNSNLDQVNSLLAKVLACNYWQLPNNLWWDIALDSRLNYHRWTEAIDRSSNKDLKTIWIALKTIAKLSENNSFELVFNQIIGAKPVEIGKDQFFTLPWLKFHFSQQISPRTDFIIFIHQFNKLKMFFNNWLEYSDEKVRLSDFIRFIKLIDRDYIKLVDHSTISTNTNAVTLTTAYKAKGKEWDYVFVLNCNNKLWAKTHGSSLDQFSLPIAYNFIKPASYLSENIVKPFYVSITRAKKQLVLNNYILDDRGLSTEPLDWIDQKLVKHVNIPSSNKAEITNFLNQDWQSKLLSQKNDYKQVLEPLLDNFKLSATHLNNYLEITDVSTNSFIFSSLLKVPQVVQPRLIYGTAMHSAINSLHKINANENRLIPVTELIEVFNKNLNNTPLTKDEIKFFAKKGHDELSIWYEKDKQKFNSSDLSEYKIGQVFLDSGPEKLTGEIDLLRFENKLNASIVDYKSTIPPAKDSKLIKDPKEYRYRRQLLFYKILLDSIHFKRDSKPVNVKTGVIEFLSPNESGDIVENQIEFVDSDIERMKSLIIAVWKKIMNLDIIDTTRYEKSVKGMISLEDDLISGKL
jgi:DNA helicase-2/ATP-dependent DNA helicase PcrA